MSFVTSSSFSFLYELIIIMRIIIFFEFLDTLQISQFLHEGLFSNVQTLQVQVSLHLRMLVVVLATLPSVILDMLFVFYK